MAATGVCNPANRWPKPDRNLRLHDSPSVRDGWSVSLGDRADVPQVSGVVIASTVSRRVRPASRNRWYCFGSRQGSSRSTIWLSLWSAGLRSLSSFGDRQNLEVEFARVAMGSVVRMPDEAHLARAVAALNRIDARTVRQEPTPVPVVDAAGTAVSSRKPSGDGHESASG